jgi:methionyl-tRNA formyltransferase
MTTAVVRRMLLFGDALGIPQGMKVAPRGLICGLVCAEIRPQDHAVLEDLSRKHGLPLLVQPPAKSRAYPKFLEQVRGLEPDLIVVNSYSMLLRDEILTLPRFGAVNIHGALLPQYRGCNPIQCALLNNESETGVTIHYMTPEFDAGDIVAQRRVPIYFEDTWLDIRGRLTRATDKLLSEELPRLLSVTNDRQRQDERQARYYKRRRPEHGLIDFKQSVLAIYNLVRALVRPHPGAFYYAGSEKVIVDEYRTIPEVVALKYGAEGGQQLQSVSLRLCPLVDGVRRSNDVVLFAIRSVRTDRSLGTCELRSVNYRDRSGELSIRLEEPSSQEARLLLEIAGLLTQFAFSDLRLRRLRLYVPPNRAQDIGLYERVGFVREANVRQAGDAEGGEMDVVAMGILHEDHGP